MATFVVSYDLVEEGAKERDYDGLIADLKSMDSCHPQDSVWYVARNCTQVELKDRLKKFLHEKDRLMVVEFTKRPNFTQAFAGTNKWLDKHFG